MSIVTYNKVALGATILLEVATLAMCCYPAAIVHCTMLLCHILCLQSSQFFVCDMLSKKMLTKLGKRTSLL